MYRELHWSDIKYADEPKSVKLKEIPFGMVFKRRIDGKQIYIRESFVRNEGLNKYSCTYYDDMNKEVFLKGDTIVYIGFEV
jgi:small nuclear ribonucleoprotein (snRNP)-like protein